MATIHVPQQDIELHSIGGDYIYCSNYLDQAINSFVLSHAVVIKTRPNTSPEDAKKLLLDLVDAFKKEEYTPTSSMTYEISKSPGDTYISDESGTRKLSGNPR